MTEHYHSSNHIIGSRLMFMVFVMLFSCTDNYEIIATYPNGNTRLECQLKDGLKSGECKGYYPDGQLDFISEYRRDTLHGKSSFYHPNGELNWISYFENGLKNGTVEYFDSTGTIFQSSTFRNSMLHGKSYQYENGIIKNEMNYDNGKLDGYFIGYNSSGSMVYKAKYAESQKIWTEEYDSLGSLISRRKVISYNEELRGDTLSIYAKLHGFSHDVLGFEPDTSMTSMLITDYFFSTNDSIEIKLIINKTQEEFALTGSIFEMDTIPDGKGIVQNIEDVYYIIDLSHQ